MNIDLYTDGSCSGNPGPGGWSFVAIVNGVQDSEEYGMVTDRMDMIWDSTSQQAELTACAKAVRWAGLKLKGCKDPENTVRIFSDSAYLLNCLKDKWYVNWRLSANQKGEWFTKTAKTPVANQWIWERILWFIEQLSKQKVTFQYIKVEGHTGDVFNERADKLAKKGTQMATTWDRSVPAIVKMSTENPFEKVDI